MCLLNKSSGRRDHPKLAEDSHFADLAVAFLQTCRRAKDHPTVLKSRVVAKAAHWLA